MATIKIQMNSYLRSDLKLSTGVIFALVTLQLAILSVFSVSHESLWIDEFSSAQFAMLRTFGSMWFDVSHSSGSSAQTPLYYFYLFGWEKVFGSGEYALRAANLPLMAMAEGAMLWALRDSRKMFFGFFFLSSFHAILWYYMNEARPYVMMYTGVCLLVASCISLYRLDANSDREPGVEYWLFSVGAIVLAGSSMLGAPWIASAAGFVCFLDRPCRYQITRKNAFVPLAMMSVVIAILGIYYLKTLLNQSGGSHLDKTTFLTLAFSAYESIGLSGLGPGRLELRGHGIGTLIKYLYVLVPVGATFIVVAYAGLKSAIAEFGPRRFLIILILVLLPVILISVGGIEMHWRAVGRHYIPVVPVIILTLTAGLIKLLEQKLIIGRIVALIFVVGFAMSAITMGVADRHKKDDYRTAVSIAKAATNQGESVWWGAFSGPEMNYYDLKLENNQNESCPAVLSGKAIGISNVLASCLEHITGPDLIILSKPETFDTNNALRQMVSEHHYALVESFPAFWIYQRPDLGASRLH